MSYFEETQKKFDKFEKETNDARRLILNVIYKIILISASIVAFSVSLVSLELTKKSINIQLLYLS